MLILIFVRVEIICVFQEVPYCWCTMQVDVRQTIIRAHFELLGTSPQGHDNWGPKPLEPSSSRNNVKDTIPFAI